MTTDIYFRRVRAKLHRESLFRHRLREHLHFALYVIGPSVVMGWLFEILLWDRIG